MKRASCDLDGIDARRIARNAGWLYVRLAVVTVSGLIAVRVVMNALGVSGFGVFSAVSGAVSLIFFLQWTMELAVRRFLCVEIEKGAVSSLAETLTGGFLLALTAVLLFVGVAETVGRWFVQEKMSFGSESVGTALLMLQLLVCAQVLETVRLPFEALIVASERMVFFAKVSVLEALLALGAAGAVACVGGRGLEAYAGFLLVKSAVVFLVSVFYCRRTFGRLVAFRRGVWRRFAEQAAFFGKSLLGDSANMLKYHGVNMLVNVHAGPAFNASWNMSMQVGTSLYGLVGNFQQAFFPQIVRLWTREDKRPFVVLLAGTIRWSAIVMGACALPLLVLTGPILVLWLGGTLPPQASAFTRCVAVHYFFDALIGPLHTAIVATGKIFRYNVFVSLIMASSFFLAWTCLAGGLPAWTSIASVAAVNVVAFLYRLHYVRRHLGVAVLPLLRKAFFPATVFHVE